MKQSQDAILDGVQKEYAAHIEREYRSAIREIDKQIRAWYQRVATNNSVSYADAKKLLTKDELSEFKWDVREYMRHAWENADGSWNQMLENASARVHISRLDALKIQLQQRVQELADKQINIIRKATGKAFSESYYHTAFEVQSEARVGVTMQGIDKARLEVILRRPWTVDGKNFVARCWSDKNRLVNILNRELTRMVATGEQPRRAIDKIAKEFNTSKANAGRLVNTEAAHAASEAQKQTFTELKVERYMIVATLSTTTCSECGDEDGLFYPMSEFNPGVTAPPFHPNCRCTTKPYDEDVEKFAMRIYRDPETRKTNYVPANMNYKAWKAIYVDKTMTTAEWSESLRKTS